MTNRQSTERGKSQKACEEEVEDSRICSPAKKTLRQQRDRTREKTKTAAAHRPLSTYPVSIDTPLNTIQRGERVSKARSQKRETAA